VVFPFLSWRIAGFSIELHILAGAHVFHTKNVLAKAKTAFFGLEMGERKKGISLFLL